MKKILWAVLTFISINAYAGNSRDNEIDWIIASSAASSQSHIIQWKKSFPNDDCKAVSYTHLTLPTILLV